MATRRSWKSVEFRRKLATSRGIDPAKLGNPEKAGNPQKGRRRMFAIRVSDPYSFFTDPDPDPEDPDGGQYGSGYGSGSGSNPDPGL